MNHINLLYFCRQFNTELSHCHKLHSPDINMRTQKHISSENKQDSVCLTHTRTYTHMRFPPAPHPPTLCYTFICSIDCTDMWHCAHISVSGIYYLTRAEGHIGKWVQTTWRQVQRRSICYLLVINSVISCQVCEFLALGLLIRLKWLCSVLSISLKPVVCKSTHLYLLQEMKTTEVAKFISSSPLFTLYSCNFSVWVQK